MTPVWVLALSAELAGTTLEKEYPQELKVAKSGMPNRPSLPTNWTVPLLLTKTPGRLAAVVSLINDAYMLIQETSAHSALVKLKPLPVKTPAEVKPAFWPP